MPSISGENPAGSSEIQVVAIAASEGGVEALKCLVQGLPPDFPVPILVVQHLAPHFNSRLDDILQIRSALPVRFAEDGEKLQPGTIYLAPPDRHLIVGELGVAKLTRADRVNWVRPAADVLFKSVARHYGSRSMAIVLTGNLFDGAAGSVAIKRAGGWVLVQDRNSSKCFDMPRSAIKKNAVDYVLPLHILPFAMRSLIMAAGATALFRVPCRLDSSPDTLCLN